MTGKKRRNSIELKAPRQALFAFILLINFLLTAALLIYSLSNNESINRQNQGEMLKKQLGQSVTNPVLTKDTVGVSLIAKHYADLPNVNGIRIYNQDNEVLSEVGKALSISSEVFTADVTKDDAKIGSVKIFINKTDLGSLVKNQWVIFVGSGLLHLFLFLVYNLIARQFVVRETIPHRKFTGDASSLGYVQEDSALQYEADEQAITGVGMPNVSENGMFADLLDEQTQESSTTFNENIQTSSKTYKEPSFADPEIEVSNTHSKEPVITTHQSSIDDMRLNIQFEDPKLLLPKLTVGKSRPLYDLCDQLLNNAINALLDDSIMPQQVSFNVEKFSEKGATVTALSEDKEKAAYACFLLGQLYIFLHQVKYQKYIELDNFALPCKACLSSTMHIDTLMDVLNRDGKASDFMMLLNVDESELFVGKVEMRSYISPKTVVQRNIGTIEAVHQDIVNQLSVLRNSILKSIY